MADRNEPTVVVLGADGGRLGWRAGSATASYADRGYRCVSFGVPTGERGESEWKIPGMTGDRVVRENRLDESGSAVKNRGSEGHFFEMGDYPRVRNWQDVVEPVNEFREHRPAIVLTHGFEDPYNMDHPPTNHRTLEARVGAQESGCRAQGKGSRAEPRRSSSSSRTIRSDAISGTPVPFEITSIGKRKRNGRGVDGRPGTPCEVLDGRGRTPGGRASVRPGQAPHPVRGSVPTHLSASDG